MVNKSFCKFIDGGTDKNWGQERQIQNKCLFQWEIAVCSMITTLDLSRHQTLHHFLNRLLYTSGRYGGLHGINHLASTTAECPTNISKANVKPSVETIFQEISNPPDGKLIMVDPPNRYPYSVLIVPLSLYKRLKYSWLKSILRPVNSSF